MITVKTLSNGVRVTLEEIPYVRSICLGIWVKNGSKNEEQCESGASHFIEHMLFKGTPSRSARDIAEEMDSIGGQINAYTTKEFTCYHTRVLDKHMDLAMEILGDMFLNSNFAPGETEKERNVILEEINMYEDAPEELVYDILQEAMWKKSAIGRPILGTRKSVSAMDSERLISYYKRHYRNDNTVISLAGNFRSDEILAALEKVFGGWKTEPQFAPEADRAEYTPVTVTRKRDTEQLYMCFAMPGIKRGHPARFAAAVLNTIFGGGMSSRLFQKIREENGLTYAVYSLISTYDNAGIFGIYAGLSPNQCGRVIKLIFQEMAGIFSQPISEKALDNTKEQIISNLIMSSENTQSRMMGAGSSLLLLDRIEDTDFAVKGLSEVTLKDIYELAERLFHMDMISFSAVGNVEGLDFEGMLKDGKKEFLYRKNGGRP